MAVQVDHLDQHWLKKGVVKQTNWQCLCLITMKSGGRNSFTEIGFQAERSIHLLEDTYSLPSMGTNNFVSRYKKTLLLMKLSTATITTT